MFVRDLEEKKRRIALLLDAPPPCARGDLRHVAERILGRRAAILAVAARRATPFYLFDRDGFVEAARTFAATFSARVPGHRPFYAVKSNFHPHVLRGAIAEGYGLDVSSGREFRLAQRHGARAILWSGPAKSTADLDLAADHADRTIVHLDSFRELERLGEVTRRRRKTVRAGVRVTTSHHGTWSKFGVPLADLGRFWKTARAHPRVRLEGVQFHLSWNRNAVAYQRILADLGARLRADLDLSERRAVRFVDFGGGYKPHLLEGHYPSGTPLGAAVAAGDEHFGEETEFLDRYYVKESIPLDEYARAIGEAIDEHLRPVVDCDYFSEPGRILSTFAMHLLLRVVDKKAADLVIVDGGINMVGWERYLHIYAPVVNLTRPATREIPVRIYGSLCDPEDIWGFQCYGESIEEGDLLIVPYQGAYSFAVAQNFIRAIPPVYALPARPLEG